MIKEFFVDTFDIEANHFDIFAGLVVGAWVSFFANAFVDKIFENRLKSRVDHLERILFDKSVVIQIGSSDPEEKE